LKNSSVAKQETHYIIHENLTRIMAEQIAKGIKEADEDVNVKIFNLAKSDKMMSLQKFSNPKLS
jgi:hypothetical protein